MAWAARIRFSGGAKIRHRCIFAAELLELDNWTNPASSEPREERISDVIPTIL